MDITEGVEFRWASQRSHGDLVQCSDRLAETTQEPALTVSCNALIDQAGMALEQGNTVVLASIYIK